MFTCHADGNIEIPLSYFNHRELNFYPPALPLGSLVLINNNNNNNNDSDNENNTNDYNETNNVDSELEFVKCLLIELKRKFILKSDLNLVYDYSPNINNILGSIKDGRDDNILFIYIPQVFFPRIKRNETLHNRISRIVSNTHRITWLVEKFRSLQTLNS
ncbi:hypothetical protein TCON_2076 [Astathelohania contejeani]|uniref:Uncharacterized protein n=1 Tax=Astathelohania contejeani TaxID=164912 RepID=A0ABQ7HX21_9MICR|nr:hypothetical protein TCON_2076 [Thelohania contejeani]